MKTRRLPVYSTDTDGKQTKRLSPKFYAIFVDHAGELRRLPLLKDRGASVELARTVDRLNSLKSAGDNVLPPELARAVEVMPGNVREKLAEWNIISLSKSAASKPLLEHLADWQTALTARANTAQHVSSTIARVGRVVRGCKFVTVSDVSASDLQKFIADRRNDTTNKAGKVKRGISATSFNYYLRDCRSFFTWMVNDKRCHENPVAMLENINTRTDRRHDRRALSPDELRWMLDTTITTAGERNGMAGRERSMLYRLAAETGLRAGELRSLTRASFRLDEDPTVTIAAAYAKNRRQDTLPLRSGTAALLADHLAGKLPAAIAFTLPKKDRIVEMFRADLSAARTAWLASHQNSQDRRNAEETTFLSPVDDAGCYADFHALRHTFISNLASGGVHPKTAQRLARHSTIGLTMDRYTHMHKDDMADALDSLPDLSAPDHQRARATGTDDTSATGPKFVSLPVSPDHAIRGNHAHLGAINSAGVEPGDSIGNTAQIDGISPVENTDRPLGGIGRRDGFKIHFLTEYRFKSDRGHKIRF